MKIIQETINIFMWCKPTDKLKWDFCTLWLTIDSTYSYCTVYSYYIFWEQILIYCIATPIFAAKISILQDVIIILINIINNKKIN